MSTKTSLRAVQDTILVVEDDPDYRGMLSRRFRLMGFETIAVADGDAAVGWLESHIPPRLVCLDLALPTMSGFHVCELLRARPSTRNTPILVVTGRTSLQDHTLALEVGADVFLEKPVRWPDFEDAVHALLGFVSSSAFERSGSSPLSGEGEL